jgi:hypothetical protein
LTPGLTRASIEKSLSFIKTMDCIGNDEGRSHSPDHRAQQRTHAAVARRASLLVTSAGKFVMSI